jgi:hypothetical protein
MRNLPNLEGDARQQIRRKGWIDADSDGELFLEIY